MKAYEIGEVAADELGPELQAFDAKVTTPFSAWFFVVWSFAPLHARCACPRLVPLS